MPTKRVVSPPDLRRRELAQIHIAKDQLGMDDDTYRAMLFAIGRVRSAADLDFGARKRVLEHLRSRGFHPVPPAGAQRGRSVKAGAPKQRKILALWLSLREAGALEAGNDAALGAFIHRQTGVRRMEWLERDQADKVIEALKGWLARVQRGTDQPSA